MGETIYRDLRIDWRDREEPEDWTSPWERYRAKKHKRGLATPVLMAANSPEGGTVVVLGLTSALDLPQFWPPTFLPKRFEAEDKERGHHLSTPVAGHGKTHYLGPHLIMSEASFGTSHDLRDAWVHGLSDLSGFTAQSFKDAEARLSGHRSLYQEVADSLYRVVGEAPSPESGSVIVDVDEDAIRKELADPKWDFRTVDGVASSIGTSPEAVEAVLDRHPDLVRWVPATDDEGRLLLTSASRPISRRERLIRIKAALTKSLV